ncbi:MAG: DUF5320 domain-containing protein [Pirellulales bacterium]|nr:DUF5320 domain-containing protein [Pirellulales bacterium]
MPGGNRTGPMGMGPMTGRGAGYCAGNSVPGYMNRGFGGGYFGGGWGRGGGRGWRNMFYATGLPGWARGGAGFGADPSTTGAFDGVGDQQQLDALKQQARQMADSLEIIRRRISELESGAAQ